MNKYDTETLNITLPRVLMNTIMRFTHASNLSEKRLSFTCSINGPRRSPPTPGPLICAAFGRILAWAEQIVHDSISPRTPGREITL
jgi:hypothetical protein